MLPRFYLAEDIIQGQSIELDHAATHHAGRVLRLKTGDSIVLFNGKGGEYHSHIENMSKSSTTVVTDQFVATERESPINIEVVQALCVNEKMDWIIQKSVELGVTRIQPVFTTRSIVRLSEERAIKRLQHWQKIIIAACEQCGRNQIPFISPLASLTNWLSRRQVNTPNCLDFMLSINGSHHLKNVPRPSTDTQVTLAVGPEGGWTDEEEHILRRADFAALRMGQRILRTETAALATIAAIQICWGDF